MDKNTHKENKNKTGNVWRAVEVEEEVGAGGYRVRVLEMFVMTGESSNIFRGPLCSPLLEYKSSDKATDIFAKLSFIKAWWRLHHNI